MMVDLFFRVPGIPVPQGSKRAFGGRVVEANKNLRPWRGQVTASAVDAITTTGWGITGRPVHVDLRFEMPRPKAHYRTGAASGEVKPSAPLAHIRKPDLDKLVRAVLDGLTDAGVWVDDSQVAHLTCEKYYGNAPGVMVSVEELEE